jgi:putative transposase
LARIARIVVPGVPHHVTQRGNRQQPIFFREGDQGVYRRMLAAELDNEVVTAWAYCLMPNHVHLILEPSNAEGMARAVGQAHRRYTSFINQREGWTGHLFQGRFASVPMDEDHAWNAVVYVTLNPVRAGLCRRAADWPWSSVHAHLSGEDDALAKVAPVLDRFGDFAARLREIETGKVAPIDFDALRRAETTGRPVGSAAFVKQLEALTGRALAPLPRGPKGAR